MLDVTRRLADRDSDVSSRWRSAAAAAVLRYGTQDDAEALLPAFLAAPEARGELLPVLARHGDVSTAERLTAATVVDGRLKTDVPSEVLRVVGHLGYEAAEQVLWHHIVREGWDYYEAMDAALGLAQLPCRGLEDQIDAALALHLGANLFPEFLPALAVKTGTAGWLGRLVEWGEGGASTDCNGGLILGIALHGEAGRAEFGRLLRNPWWEADSGATGSSRWAYAGARALGLRMAELYDDLVTGQARDSEESVRRHGLSMFVALLEHWVSRPWLGLRMVPDSEESADELAALLFDWSTPHEDDSLTGLANRVLGSGSVSSSNAVSASGSRLSDKIHELERRLDARLNHEVQLEVLTGVTCPDTR